MIGKSGGMKMDMKSDGKAMDMKSGGMKMDQMDHSAHVMVSPDIERLNYSMLKAPNYHFPKDAPVRELHFELTGNMNRYLWSMDNKVLSESIKFN
jgi:FtsP/CotA-like multicopper oxidase with cupredoxin domain